MPWWQPVLIALALLIAFALLRMARKFVDLEKEMRRAAASGADGEDAAATAAFFRMRRQTVVRSILLLLLVLTITVFPVVKFWYGLE